MWIPVKIKERLHLFDQFVVFLLVFLLFFLITGLLYQRITDIVAFLICSTLLTIYVIQHYFTAKDDPDNRRITQPEIRLVKQKETEHIHFD